MERFVSFFLKRKESESAKDFNFRAGNFASVFGLVVNILLFVLKLIVGVLASSVAIIADSINNLTDSFSSCIAVVSFQIAKKPADKEHPFGHARAEYLFSSVVAIIIVIVGVQLFWHSLLKIKNPLIPDYSIYAILILSFSILAKLFLSLFYMTIARKINSAILKATSVDSRADVLSTLIILISVFVYYFTYFSIDSYLGLIVSIFIIKSGFEILKNTIDHILGVAPTKKEITQIRDFILSYDGIEGVHDIIIHDYGANYSFVSAHAEVDASREILESHAIIEQLESDAVNKLGVQLIVHMDPIVKNNPEIEVAINKINLAIKKAGLLFEIHNFRLVNGYKVVNVIFDVNVPCQCKFSDAELSEKIKTQIKKIDPTYNPVITFDRYYIRSPYMGEIK